MIYPATTIPIQSSCPPGPTASLVCTFQKLVIYRATDHYSTGRLQRCGHPCNSTTAVDGRMRDTPKPYSTT